MYIVQYFKAFALTGRQVCVRNYPGRCPGLEASALSGRVELTCEVLFFKTESPGSNSVASLAILREGDLSM